MQHEWEYSVVRCTSMLDGGERFEWEVRCFIYPDAVFVDIAEIMLKFFAHRRHVQVWKELQRQRPMWASLCGVFNYDLDAEYQGSTRRAKCIGQQGGAHVRSVHCVSVRFLVLLLANYAARSYLKWWRHRGAAMLRTFFEEFLEPTTCTAELLDELWGRVGFGRCGCENSEHCLHCKITELREAFSGAGPHECFAHIMVKLMLASTTCRFARDAFHEYTLRVAQGVRETLRRGKGAIPHHKVLTESRPSGRTKVSDSFRYAVVKGLRKLKRVRHGKHFVRADGLGRGLYRKWLLRDVAGYMHAINRVMGQEHLGKEGCSLMICEDATRLGNPARETLILVASSPATRTSCVMVPQAPACSLASGPCPVPRGRSEGRMALGLHLGIAIPRWVANFGPRCRAPRFEKPRKNTRCRAPRFERH